MYTKPQMLRCVRSPRLINGLESSAPTFYIKRMCTFLFPKFEQVCRSLNNIFQCANEVHVFKRVGSLIFVYFLVILPKPSYKFSSRTKLLSNLAKRNKTFKNEENVFVLTKKMPKNLFVRWIVVENGPLKEAPACIKIVYISQSYGNLAPDI